MQTAPFSISHGADPVACDIASLQLLELVTVEPRRAVPEVGPNPPQVCHDVGRLEEGPRPVEGRAQLVVLDRKSVV